MQRRKRACLVNPYLHAHCLPPHSCSSDLIAPPFPPGSFDRILLDGPCSGLGQRPKFREPQTLKAIYDCAEYVSLFDHRNAMCVRLCLRNVTVISAPCCGQRMRCSDQVRFMNLCTVLTMRSQRRSTRLQHMHTGSGGEREQRCVVPPIREGHDLGRAVTWYSALSESDSSISLHSVELTLDLRSLALDLRAGAREGLSAPTSTLSAELSSRCQRFHPRCAKLSTFALQPLTSNSDMSDTIGFFIATFRKVAEGAV